MRSVNLKYRVKKARIKNIYLSILKKQVFYHVE